MLERWWQYIVRLLLSILLFGLASPCFANSIDSLKTDNDIELFLKRIDKRFSSDKYNRFKVLPTAVIKQKLGCDSILEKWNINNWEKSDFNNDGKTDLIATISWYDDFDVFVAVDKGDNKYQLIQLSKDVFENCELAKPIKIGSEILLLFYRKKNEYNDPIKNIFDYKLVSKIDTLVYKYGGFIEKQTTFTKYDISEIEYHVSSGWSGISPISKLKISSKGTASFETISNDSSKVFRDREVNTEIVKSILDLMQYMSIYKLRNKYLVNWTDATTMFLKITFRDGSIKEIEDYGMIGTFGLSQLYQLLGQASK